MDLILEAKDANEWSYRGEGAANLVLSYNGTSSELVGKVIRVQKASNDGSIYENGHLAWSEHEQMMWKDAGSMVTAPTKDIAEQQFLQCVMIPLLGSEYVDAGLLLTSLHHDKFGRYEFEDFALRLWVSWTVRNAQIFQGKDGDGAATLVEAESDSLGVV